ncbi:MAG: dihydroorotate dehydrogenase (quinone) [Chloroflexi bacterium HGW-Chloroflexi-10]|nr:MAG: dihydroorotate dehydrogenase (quinone) [Chloroflexi bacterium HGW-Chloroflexi-10]
MNLYPVIKPLLFQLQPEQAHGATVAALRLAGCSRLTCWCLQRCFAPRVVPRPVHAFGLTFPNAIGLAAGYDKNAEVVPGLAGLGFGHIEVGTVTPLAQPGNPQPRLFRLVEDRAVINRMGFNNPGGALVAENLVRMKRGRVVIGVNIGKNKLTPNERAAEDYVTLVRQMAPLADYLVINVSSPNTPGLRALQSETVLREILIAAVAERNDRAHDLQKMLPILVKLSPDMPAEGLAGALQAAVDGKVDGVIVTNTTLAREGITSRYQEESGGLSGAPLRERSLAVLKEAVTILNGELPVVASGGVMTAEDARARLDAGAVLVQLYTGLVFLGPGLVRECVERTAREDLY